MIREEEEREERSGSGKKYQDLRKSRV